MASIYKKNKCKEGEPYRIQYTDHTGKRCEKKGFTDRGLTEHLAWRLEEDVRKRKEGLIYPKEKRLAEAGGRSLDEHLTGYEKSLSETTPKHRRLTLGRIRRLFDGSEFEKLADLDAERLEGFLKLFVSTNDFGPRTYNHYLQAVDGFCNWCVRTKRLNANPLRGLDRRNAALDTRRQRRALKPDGFSRLLAFAEASRKSVQCYDGPTRARIHYLAYTTGLRKKEIGSLSPSSFNLDGTPSILTLEAKASKHRRKDVLPLDPELVAKLRDWTAGMTPKEKAVWQARRPPDAPDGRLRPEDRRHPLHQRRGRGRFSRRRSSHPHHRTATQRRESY